LAAKLIKAMFLLQHIRIARSAEHYGCHISVLCPDEDTILLIGSRIWAFD